MTFMLTILKTIRLPQLHLHGIHMEGHFTSTLPLNAPLEHTNFQYRDLHLHIVFILTSFPSIALWWYLKTIFCTDFR